MGSWMHRRRLGVLLAALGLAIGMGRGLAQEGTPPGEEHLVAHHPAHVHQGSCASPNPEPAYTLTEVEMDLAAMEQGPAIPVMTSVTTINTKLDDLLARPYAIDVHELRELAIEERRPLACGDLGSQPTGDTLAVGLREQNASGLMGIAVLQAVGDQTIVTLYLAHGLSGDAHGEGREQESATVAFYVPTITCPGCQFRVEGSIRQTPGILDIACDGQTVTVTYDPNAVTPDEIKAAIEVGGDEVYAMSAGD